VFNLRMLPKDAKDFDTTMGSANMLA